MVKSQTYKQKYEEAKDYAEAMSYAHTQAMLDTRESNIAFAALLKVTPTSKIRDAFTELWELKNK